MKNLVIIGARGFGRDCFHNLLLWENYGQEFLIKGFLDSKADALDGLDGYAPILDSVEEYIPQPDDIFICALGDSVHRKKYAQMILDKGGHFATLINPRAIVHPNAKIGKGVMIAAYCKVSANSQIGDFSILQLSCNVGHDAIVGEWCSLRAFSFVGGGAVIEDGCTLQPHATVLPQMKVGAWATVGANSVVVRKVKAGTTVSGNPAVRLKW